MTDQSTQTWGQRIKALHEESAGMMLVEVVRPQDMPEVLAAALTGNKEAIDVLRGVHHTIEGVKKAPKHRAMLCGSCPRHLRTGPYSVIVAFPARDNPGQMLNMGICHRCASTREEVLAKAAKALQRIWPDLRALDRPMHPGGHA